MVIEWNFDGYILPLSNTVSWESFYKWRVPFGKNHLYGGFPYGFLRHVPKVTPKV